MIHSIFALTLLTLFASAYAEEKSPPNLTPRTLTAKEVARNEFVLLKKLPNTYAGFAKILPSLKVKKEEKVKNSHVESLVDTIVYGTFTGGSVDFFRGAEASPPESIVRLRLKQQVPAIKLEPSVGSSRKDLESAFGVKTNKAKKYALCEIQEAHEGNVELGSACAEFYFQGDTVKEIVWEFPID